MPIYHFHVHDGRGVPHVESCTLADLGAARADAVRRIPAILTQRAPGFWCGKPYILDVSDESGLTLFSLTFLATEAPLASSG